MKRSRRFLGLLMVFLLAFSVVPTNLFSVAAAEPAEPALQATVTYRDLINHTLTVEAKNVSGQVLEDAKLIVTAYGSPHQTRLKSISLEPGGSMEFTFAFSHLTESTEYKVIFLNSLEELQPLPLQTEKDEVNSYVVNDSANGYRYYDIYIENNKFTILWYHLNLELPLSKNYIFTYNGESASQSMDAIFASIKENASSSIRLIDADNDKVFEEIQIEDYKTIVVDYIEGSTIHGLAPAGASLTLNSTDSLTYQGQEIAVSHLQKYDVVNYYTSQNGTFTKAMVTRNMIYGRVIEVDPTYGIMYYVLEEVNNEGKKHGLYQNCCCGDELTLASYYEVYLDAFGTLAYIVTKTGPCKYVYLSSASINKGLVWSIDFHVLDIDGIWKVYKSSHTMKYQTEDGDFAKADTYTEEGINAVLKSLSNFVDGGKIVPQMVQCFVSTNDDIKQMIPLGNVQQQKTGVYNAQTRAIGDIPLDDNTTIFVDSGETMGTNSKMSVMDQSSLIDGMEYAFSYFINPDTGYAAYFVLHPHTPQNLHFGFLKTGGISPGISGRLQYSILTEQNIWQVFDSAVITYCYAKKDLTNKLEIMGIDTSFGTPYSAGPPEQFATGYYKVLESLSDNIRGGALVPQMVCYQLDSNGDINAIFPIKNKLERSTGVYNKQEQMLGAISLAHLPPIFVEDKGSPDMASNISVIPLSHLEDGKTYTFSIYRSSDTDKASVIVLHPYSSETAQYGYLKNSAVSSDIDATVQYEMLCSDGTWQIFDSAPEVLCYGRNDLNNQMEYMKLSSTYGAPYSAGESTAFATGRYKIMETLSDNIRGGAIVPQMVQYWLNDKGEISGICPAEFTILDKISTYREELNYLGPLRLDQNTKVFVQTGDASHRGNITVQGSQYFEDREMYQFSAVEDSQTGHAKMIYLFNSYPADTGDTFVVDAINKKDDQINTYSIRGYFAGEPDYSELLLHTEDCLVSEVVFDAKTKQFQLTSITDYLGKIKAGTVLQIVSEDGKIKAMQIVFQPIADYDTLFSSYHSAQLLGIDGRTSKTFYAFGDVLKADTYFAVGDPQVPEECIIVSPQTAKMSLITITPSGSISVRPASAEDAKPYQAGEAGNSKAFVRLYDEGAKAEVLIIDDQRG